MPVVISNASPLIGLAKIEALSLLQQLWSEIIIPQAVYEETVENARGKPGADLISDACTTWIKTVSVKNLPEAAALQAVLDRGEAEVIVLGQ